MKAAYGDMESEGGMQIKSPIRWWLSVWLLSTLLFSGAKVWSTEIVLADGRVLLGKLGKVAGLADVPLPTQPDAEGPLQLIVFVDDELRRTFVSDRLVREVRQEEARQVEEKFHLRQRVLRSGPSVRAVGWPLRVEPFDEYGRRIFTMRTAKGAVDVIQGITELTPQWTKVEGISHVWDMRIATSSIPPETLRKILFKLIDPKNIEHHKKLARFYLQSERYEEARKILEELLASFPDRSELKEQLAPSLRAIVQMSAARLAAELRVRHEAGQHRLVFDGLRRFPSEGVGGEILQKVREMLADYEARLERGRKAVEHLKALAERLRDTIARENLKPILEEIEAELGFSTLDRLAAFLQSADDPQTSDEEKLALAISGWLLGADGAAPKLSTAISAYKVRNWLRDYLQETTAPERDRLLSYIQQESGGSVEIAAKLLAHMKPPLPLPEPTAEKPGFFRVKVTGLPDEPPVEYYVQLPPEYDPYHLYPTIVSLHAAHTTAEQQIDWWAGEWGSTGARNGQATRYGYIVIAPRWTEEHQKQYGYTAREHMAVLASLRDACRRFAIDTDRVFLSGHSIGGDAAWDMGLAHPDLWAGVIPIVAQADRYCAFYWENARYVPFYVIAGELDGAKLTHNARDLDRYLRRGFPATVVEYRGRGHEDFYDEILRLFDWMSRCRRNFFPREFTCVSMRRWDNFFWWVEMQGLPARSMVEPSDWPPNGAQPVQLKANVTSNNDLNIRTGAAQVTVWLSPKLIDFKRRTIITVNGRRINSPDQTIRPELRTLLEDARTRGERQHPFWAKLDSATGRIPSD